MAIEHVGLDDARLRIYSGLTDAQLRECYTPKSGDKLGTFNKYANGLFVAESKNVITRAMSGGYKLVSIFMEEKWLEHEMPLVQAALAADPEVPVLVVSHDAFRQLTGYQVTRGALAAFERKPLPTVEAICRDARRVAVLEDVTNYTNIGAIFRSAAALGIDAVLITPNCHDPLYRRASRVSMGTVFQVPWTRIGEAGADGREVAGEGGPAAGDAGEAVGEGGGPCSGWASTGIPQLAALGFKTAAMALVDDSVPLDDPRLAACEKLAIVLGTEGEGLARSTIDGCDFTVLIPMEHDVDSLNVAAASAVAFWELRKR